MLNHLFCRRIFREFIFLPFGFLLHSFNAKAQNNTIDSLQKVLQIQKEDTNKVNTLNVLSKSFFNNDDYKNALQYSNKALFLSQKLNFKRGEANAYTRIGVVYGNQNNLLEARKNFIASLKISETLKDKKLIAEMNLGIAKSFGMEENYPEALKFFYSSLRQWEEIGSDNMIALTLSDIGFILYYQGNLSESLKTWLKALELYKKIEEKDGIARAYVALAVIYYNQNNFQEAVKNNSAALKIYVETDNKSDMFYVFENLGNIDEKQASLAYAIGEKEKASIKYNEALSSYHRALNSAQEAKDTALISIAYADLGNIHIKLKNFSKATDYFKKSLQMTKGSKENLKTVYNSLSYLDSLHGNFKQAYEDYKKYILYRDSLVNEESTKKSLQSKMQYEFDKKEAVTKAEQAKKDLETKRVKNLQYFAIGGLGVVVLAVLLIASVQWRHNKQKKKVNALLTQQKEKVETTLSELKATQTQLIQSEKMASLGELTAGIAHEIQNPLNFVNNFSEVNTELIEELEKEIDNNNIAEVKAIASDIKDNEQKINHHGKRADAIVKGMLQHSRSSSGIKEPTDINALADEYFRLAYHGLRAKDKSFNAIMKTDFDESVGNINIIPQDIGRVILNLITNAFYAVTEKNKSGGNDYEPTVTVTTRKINNKVEIKVKDNGNGIPQKVLDKIFQPFFTTKPTGQGTGLGLSLAYDIIKAHGGEIKVETEDGEGSEFIIQLPAK